MRQFEVYMCDIPILNGDVIGGARPCIIISNDMENMYSSRVIVIPTTSNMKRLDLPVNVKVNLEHESMAICNQIMTLSKENVGRYLTRLNDFEIREIKTAIFNELGVI